MQLLVVRKLSLYSCLLYLCLIISGASCTANYGSLSVPSGSDSLSFIVIGDWGRDGEGHQQSVADQMNIMGNKFKISFIITTGDNFYSDGVKSIRDPQWKSSFENVYTRQYHQLPWYPTLGNHDYGTNPQAQVDYTATSKRWQMPARYYSLTRAISGGDSALFVFTDTSPFVTAYHSRSMADLQQQDTAAQRQWLQHTLVNANHKWKIVVGHHPIVSSGPHGNTLELIQRFRPVLLQSATDLYLCGHDHILEHLSLPGDGVQYFISGGGGAGNYKLQKNEASQFALSSPGFLIVTLHPDKANLYFCNEKGNILYRKQMVK